MDELQALIDALTTSRDNPPAQAPDPQQLFAGIEDATLSAMEFTAQEAANALMSSSRLTDEIVAQMDVLAETCTAIRAEIDRRESASSALEARAAELAARINPNASTQFADEEDEGEDGEGEAEAEPATAASIAPAPVTAPAGTAVAARTRPRVDLASLRRSNASAGRGDMGRGVRPSASPTVSVSAAADLPGYRPGQSISDVKELSRAVAARFGSFPIGSKNVEMRGGIAVVKRNFPDDLVASGIKGQDEEMLQYAGDERRLPGGSLAASIVLRDEAKAKAQSLDSLVAALSPNATLPGAINSVWCAPYDIDTTLCDPLESSDGFVDLPTVGVRPPGVIYTKGFDWWRLFDFNALVESCDPCFTKPCITMPCPEWDQADVCIEPFCIESCILKERAFQSWYDLFVRRAMMAFRRWQNVQVLEKILALIAQQPGTNVVNYATNPTFPGPWGSSQTTFDSLGLLASWYRDMYRMPMGSTMEVIAPHWAKEVIKRDLARRFGCGCEEIDDARVNAAFASIGLRVQWVYDWQTLVAPADLRPVTGNVPGSVPPKAREIQTWPLPPGTPPPPSGVPSPITAYPATFEVLVFPAGTFLSGRVEMFRIDGLYDSANLKQNLYTKIFFEDGVTVMQRCYRALRVTLPVCVNGGNFQSASQPTVAPCGNTNQIIDTTP